MIIAIFKVIGLDDAGMMVPFLLPFILCSVWIVIPSSAWPKWLTVNSFPIYVLHGALLYPLQLMWKRISPIDSLFKFLLAFGLLVGLSLSLAALIRRCFPNLSRLAFGGR